MATLIENQSRILHTFDNIRKSIIQKGGSPTNYVVSYANEILQMNSPSFVGRSSLTSATRQYDSSGLPYSLELNYTSPNDQNILLYCGIYGKSNGSPSIHDELSLKINNEDISCLQPILLADFHNTTASSWTSWFCPRVCLNKLKIRRGDILAVKLFLNYVYSNDTPTMISAIFTTDE